MIGASYVARVCLQTCGIFKKYHFVQCVLTLQSKEFLM